LQSSNFGFLATHDVRLTRLAARAEPYFRQDPSTALIKLRQFAEVLSGLVAANAGLLGPPNESFVDQLRRLQYERVAPREAGELFHQLRVLGNRAAHEGLGTHAEALSALKIARELGVWFHRSFGGVGQFSPGPFIPPRPPADPTIELKAELDRLRADLAASQTEAERVTAEAAAAAQARLSAERRAEQEASEKAEWSRLAEETDAQLRELSAELAAIQAASEADPAKTEAFVDRSQESAKSINLDEAATRTLIDQQLREAGWEADTQLLRYAKGGRPTKGRNLAIAEWPTDSGPADYALFVGLKLVGVIEAKRANRNVMSALRQAERYSAGIRLPDDQLHEGSPWGEFKAPFAFSTNGRPYLRQLESASGIWRRDLRRSINPAGPLLGRPTAAGAHGAH